MSAYRIVTDSCCDFPQALRARLDLELVPLTLLFRGREVTEPTDAEVKAMYDALRAGETATTSAVNPQGWKKTLEAVVAGGRDALVLAFSSGLSTTYQSACIAAQELAEEYPDRKIRVVDTLCASLGQGLLVWYACQKQQEGMDLEALAAWVRDTVPHLCHWFTVEDLKYLKRGGRISAATALLGTMLNIKPVLHMDDEGHLVSVGKVRGRKASLDALVSRMGELGLPGENDTIFISHGDCQADADYVAEKCREKYGVKTAVTGFVGAVIGSHSGPGTVALFFLGRNR